MPTTTKSEDKPVLRGAAEAIADSLVEGTPLEVGRPLVQLKDALLAENADASEAALERCASLRSGLVLALRDEFLRRPLLAPLITDDVAPKVRIEVRQTAGRSLSSEAFTVGRTPECDVQTSGDCTVSRLQIVVVSLPGCLLVVDAWSCGGTRIVRRSGSGRLAASLPSRRAALALAHGERVILLIGSRTTVTFGPAEKDAAADVSLPVDLPAPHSALTLVVPGEQRTGRSGLLHGGVSRQTEGGEEDAQASFAAAATPPRAPPAAVAAAAFRPADLRLPAAEPAPAEPSMPATIPATIAVMPPTQDGTAPTQVLASPARRPVAARPTPAVASSAPAAKRVLSAEPSRELCEPPTARARLSVAAPGMLAPGAASAAAAEAPAAEQLPPAAVEVRPARSAAAGATAPSGWAPVPAWAAVSSQPAAAPAPARWSRTLATVRASVRMQQAVAVRERLRWRCRAAERAGLLTGKESQSLQEQLRPTEDASDEVRDVLDGLGVPTAPDEVTSAYSVLWTCEICKESHRAKGWRCPFQHRFCRSCMVKWAEGQPLASCPAEGCGYRLGEHDLEDLRVKPERLKAFRAATAAAGCAVAVGQEESEVFRCPGRCGAALAMKAGEARRCWSCACGAPPTCTGCGATPYHFHGKCADVRSLRARWLAWQNGGREAYRSLQRRAAREANAQQRVLQEVSAKEAERKQSEQWKAEHCCCCPNCKRPVEKADGTATRMMICHPGCGHRFNWQDAKPYKPRAGFARRMATVMHARKVAVGGHGVRHLFTQCGLCGSGGKCIVGPRFRCIHCPNFSTCLKCEERLAGQHEAGHVFEILFEDEVDWARLSVELPRGTRARLRKSAAAGAAVNPAAAAGSSAGGRKRKAEDEANVEGIIRGQRRGRYVLELPDGLGFRHVLPADLQPLLTAKQANRLLANVPQVQQREAPTVL